MKTNGNGFKNFRVCDLVVDHIYQRELRRGWVNKIKAAFDPDLLGTFTVAWIDGRPHLVDGQHRRTAMLELGEPWASRVVPCFVCSATTIEDAARIFEGMQRTLKMRVYDKFRALVVAGDAEAIKVDGIVTGCECHFSMSSSAPDTTCAVQELLNVYRGAGFGSRTGPFPDLVRDTILVLREAFPRDHALAGAGILGVARFLHKYSGSVSRGRLAGRLCSDFSSYRNLVDAARGSTPRPWKRLMDSIANHCWLSYSHYKKNQLAPWTGKL